MLKINNSIVKFSTDLKQKNISETTTPHIANTQAKAEKVCMITSHIDALVPYDSHLFANVQPFHIPDLTLLSDVSTIQFVVEMETIITIEHSTEDDTKTPLIIFLLKLLR